MREEEEEEDQIAITYLLNISETISTSVSAAAIFSADESCGRPPNKNDIFVKGGSWN